MPGVQSILERLNVLRGENQDGQTVIGIITNSDNRVPDILTSLGLSVSPIRHGSARRQNQADSNIDFVIMSFDVGHEKPDRRIFDAADMMLKADGKAVDSTAWQKIYVGDEYGKDIVGAGDAGWNAILIGARDERVQWLDDKPAGTLKEMFKAHSAVGFGDLGRLSAWLR